MEDHRKTPMTDLAWAIAEKHARQRNIGLSAAVSELVSEGFWSLARIRSERLEQKLDDDPR